MVARLPRALAALGFDPLAVLAPSLRPRGDAATALARACRPDARVSYDEVDALVEAAAAAAGAARLPLALLAAQELDTYDEAGLLFVAGPSWLEGLERALAFQRLWGDGERFALERRDGDVTIRFSHPGASPVARAVFAELALLELAASLALLVDPAAAPRAARLAHAPLDAPERLAALLRVAPTFSAGENALVVALERAASPVRPPPGMLEAAALARAERALAALPRASSTRERVRAICAQSLRDGEAVELPAAAARLRLSPRTLQRRLEAEGVVFAVVLDEARRARVEELLARGATRKEAALLAGFADPSGLARAVRRWARAT